MSCDLKVTDGSARCWETISSYIRDLSEISREEGGGGWKQRDGHNSHEKWAVKRGRVMQICVRDHVEVHPQKEKRSSLFCKKTWEK